MFRIGCALALIATFVGAAQAKAQEKMSVVATFSILGDFVQQVGGDRVAVDVLVGPNGDIHAFTPSPTDARKLATAKLVFVNGFGLEGWVDRLVPASGTKASIVTLTQGVAPRAATDDGDKGGDADKTDPHAWQSVPNAKIYVENLRKAFIAADPLGASTYNANAARYFDQLDALDRDIRQTIAKIPDTKRVIVTNHDAFGYFAETYGIKFLPLEGLSTDAEPSAQTVAGIVTSIKQGNASAIFTENIVDPRLMHLIATEAGAKVGGTLYTDALTDARGEAPSYIALMRHNLKEFADALSD